MDCEQLPSPARIPVCRNFVRHQVIDVDGVTGQVLDDGIEHIGGTHGDVKAEDPQ